VSEPKVAPDPPGRLVSLSDEEIERRITVGDAERFAGRFPIGLSPLGTAAGLWKESGESDFKELLSYVRRHYTDFGSAVRFFSKQFPGKPDAVKAARRILVSRYDRKLKRALKAIGVR
jgi:hypothetical protein